MKPSTYQPISEEKLTSTGTSDTKTATVPNNTSGLYVTVESNPARMTITAAGDPTSSTGLILQKDQQPWFLPLGPGATLKIAGTTGATVVQLAYI